MEGIKHIIFDLGGVILNLDYNLTEQAFKESGFEDFAKMYSQLQQEKIFDDLETGKISKYEFVVKIQKISTKKLLLKK